MQQPNPPDYQVWCMGLEPKIDAQRLLWCLDSVLLVQDLKSVLRQLDLRVGGKKSELAARIKEYLDTLLASEDMEGYARVAALVTGFEIQRGAVYQNSRAAAAPREGHGPRLRPSAANGDAAAMPVRLGGPGASKGKDALRAAKIYQTQPSFPTRCFTASWRLLAPFARFPVCLARLPRG